MRLPWHYRYQATIVGQESGHVTSLTFMRFRTRRQAQRWVLEMNLKELDRLNGAEPLTLYGFQEIP